MYKFFNVFRQNYLVSSVTQAAHLCISDQKHLQRKHCIKIPGFGLSLPGLWECLGLLNSDPSVSLRLHKGKHKFNVTCTFSTPTSSVSYTLQTLWTFLRSFGGDAPIPEPTMLLPRAGVDPRRGSKCPPSHQSWSHRRPWGRGPVSKVAAAKPPRSSVMTWSPRGGLGGSLLLPWTQPNTPSKNAGEGKNCLRVKNTNAAITSGSGQPLADTLNGGLQACLTLQTSAVSFTAKTYFPTPPPP